MDQLAVILPAAGSGSRLGSAVPKPFIEIEGDPILSHTLMSFLGVKRLRQIIIAVSSDQVAHTEQLLNNVSARRSDVMFDIVEGGAERQYSIHNALRSVHNTVELVAVHDAVRPFVHPDHIEACCRTALIHDGAVLGVPAKDTIKQIAPDREIQVTPDRSLLWQAQTPQVFRKSMLIRAYESAIAEGFVGTDDSSLVERIGGKVKMVKGGRENLKITYPIDLEIAKLIIKSKNVP
ncbi:MAG: 2-C-methyl-D-erythritol 4-phosphate cytidylyltransferase [Bacteroidota bacterium]